MISFLVLLGLVSMSGGVEVTLESVHTITNPAYPGDQPLYKPIDWNFTTDAGNTLIVNCPILRLGMGLASDCLSYLKLTNLNGDETKVCHSQEDYHYRDATGGLTIEIGASGRETFMGKCQVEAKQHEDVGPVPTEGTLFFDEGSSEVDSSEHGGPPGQKSTSCSCGWANKNSKRIVGGKETAVNEFPFMAALEYNKEKMRFCGGTILTSYHVLTAGHCVLGFEHGGTDMLSVIVGSHHSNESQDSTARQSIGIKKIYLHKGYLFNGREMRNDIALIELKDEIIFNQEVGPACISPTQLDLDGKYVKIIGWGKLGHNEDVSPVLQKVDVRVVPWEDCRKKFSEYSPTDVLDPKGKTQMCTYGKSKSSCRGDSGGPVVWLDPETNRYTVVGAVSFSIICAAKHPAAHTDVSAYYEWIKEHIEASSVSPAMCSKLD